MLFTKSSELKTLDGNSKGIFFLFCFRISAFFSSNIVLKIIGFPVRLFYTFFVQWILGIDIYDSTKIGRGFNVYHGHGLVIASSAVIGDHVIVRHNTTIGNARKGGKCPVIGNYVDIGANTVIIGDIKIGDHSIIAAGSVVIKDVPENCVVAGNPAKIVKYLNQ
jgi:putative colanic acid biosynthesis acetyltransferase WcaB